MTSTHDSDITASRSFRSGGQSAVVSGALASRTAAAASMAAAGDADRAPSNLAAQVAALPSPIRLQMQLIAIRSARPDDALVPIIDLLVPDGSVQKRAAIVTAFRANDSLREQWERTWEILRAS